MQSSDSVGRKRGQHESLFPTKKEEVVNKLDFNSLQQSGRLRKETNQTPQRKISWGKIKNFREKEKDDKLTTRNWSRIIGSPPKQEEEEITTNVPLDISKLNKIEGKEAKKFNEQLISFLLESYQDYKNKQFKIAKEIDTKGYEYLALNKQDEGEKEPTNSETSVNIIISWKELQNNGNLLKPITDRLIFCKNELMLFLCEKASHTNWSDKLLKFLNDLISIKHQKEKENDYVNSPTKLQNFSETIKKGIEDKSLREFLHCILGGQREFKNVMAVLKKWSDKRFINKSSLSEVNILREENHRAESIIYTEHPWIEREREDGLWLCNNFNRVAKEQFLNTFTRGNTFLPKLTINGISIDMTAILLSDHDITSDIYKSLSDNGSSELEQFIFFNKSIYLDKIPNPKDFSPINIDWLSIIQNEDIIQNLFIQPYDGKDIPQQRFKALVDFASIESNELFNEEREDTLLNYLQRRYPDMDNIELKRELEFQKKVIQNLQIKVRKLLCNTLSEKVYKKYLFEHLITVFYEYGFDTCTQENEIEIMRELLLNQISPERDTDLYDEDEKNRLIKLLPSLLINDEEFESEIYESKELNHDQKTSALLSQLSPWFLKMNRLWVLMHLCSFGFFSKGVYYAKFLFPKLYSSPYVTNLKHQNGLELSLVFTDNDFEVTQYRQYKTSEKEYKDKPQNNIAKKGTCKARSEIAWTASDPKGGRQEATLTISYLRLTRKANESEKTELLDAFINHEPIPLEKSDDLDWEHGPGFKEEEKDKINNKEKK